MYSIKHVVRRASALAAVGVVAASLAATPLAHADSKNGPPGKPGVGCAVEDEHGNVSYVAVGTVVGLFHCGSDGEWHFGWATTNMVAPTSSGVGTATGTLATGATL